MRRADVIEGYELPQEYTPELEELRKHVECAAHLYWAGKAPAWPTRDKDWRDTPYLVTGVENVAYIATAKPVTVYGLYQYTDRLMRYHALLVKDLEAERAKADRWQHLYESIPQWVRRLFIRP